MVGALGRCAATAALAQQAAEAVWAPTSPALKKIDASSVVKAGYRENSPPFATVVVGKWCGELDSKRTRKVLDNETDDDAEEPEKVIDAVVDHMSVKTS